MELLVKGFNNSALWSCLCETSALTWRCSACEWAPVCEQQSPWAQRAGSHNQLKEKKERRRKKRRQVVRAGSHSSAQPGYCLRLGLALCYAHLLLGMLFQAGRWRVEVEVDPGEGPCASVGPQKLQFQSGERAPLRKTRQKIKFPDCETLRQNMLLSQALTFPWSEVQTVQELLATSAGPEWGSVEPWPSGFSWSSPASASALQHSHQKQQRVTQL